MASEISLFSGYDQAENRTTNYCLLVLKMLYEEHPKFLGELLSGLVPGDALEDRVGVQFRQQREIGRLVADGQIVQRPLHLYLETKHTDWFDDRKLAEEVRLIAHAHPDGSGALLLLANFELDVGARFPSAEVAAQGQNVAFSAIGFADLLEGIKSLKVTLEDFGNYLEEMGLLPNWKTRLDVVNCGKSGEKVLSLGTYACPALGGAYRHARSRYFGLYRGKRVSHIAEIDAVVDLPWPADTKPESRSGILWIQVALPVQEVRARAEQLLEAYDDQLNPGRVFVLGPLYETNFEKDSPGGMYASKMYFDVSGVRSGSAQELAGALRDRTWSSLRPR